MNTIYILLFIVGSSIAPDRYESMTSIQQEFSSEQSCKDALASLNKQVYRKADVLSAQCARK